MNQIDWPPTYTLIRHARAKYVKLRFCEQKGLLITLPKRLSEKKIPGILEENKSWILKHNVKKILDENMLPKKITLNFFAKEWPINYISLDCKVRVSLGLSNTILVLGNLENKELIRRHLVNLVKYELCDEFKTYFEKVSQEINLPFNALTLRMQKSVWGSCTADNNINLNYKLMFMPEEIARYVMVHELCHTVQHNHSKKFWQLVKKHDAHFLLHRAFLKKNGGLVPTWFY